MYAEERQVATARLVADAGRVTVTELAARFDVTTETVRRDLAVLERAGALRRVHGGAIAVPALGVEPLLAERDDTRTGEKERIAKRALDLLPARSGTLLLDAGSTTVRLAGLLPPDRDLHVVTHAVPVAARLAGAPGLDLRVLGGTVRGATQAAVGADTVAALQELRVDVAFLGTNGLSAGHGCSTPNVDEAAVKRALVAAARTVVVLADGSKLGEESTVRFARLEELDVVVTDASAPADELAALRAAGVEVLVA